MHRFFVGCAVLTAVFVGSARAGESAASPSSVDRGGPVALPQDVLEAEAGGLVAVQFIPNDSRSAQIVVVNRTKRPLTLKLPEAFVGVPVLAQQQPFGVGGGGGGGGGQAVGGGGMGGGMGGMGGGMGGGGFGMCWVAREVYGSDDVRWCIFRDWLQDDAPSWFRDAYVVHGEAFADWIHDKPTVKAGVRVLMDCVVTARIGDAGEGGQFQIPEQPSNARSIVFTVPPRKRSVVRVATVCLEHGKPEPAPRHRYRLDRAEAFSHDTTLAALLESFGRGEMSQKTAQAAAWHLANGLSWERLAAETIDHLVEEDEPYFTQEELTAARQAVAKAASLVPAESSSTAGEE